MISFVGAGPGAVDLITVRGMRLISEADMIIYAGSLVNPELLKYAKKDAEIHDSSKLTLEQVTDLMIKADKEDKNVVRLHTGDQSVYGAVREQMDILEANHISYESCPGVSACFGAASSLDLEYTLPGISQTLIITRMEGKTAVPEREKISLLASHKASMAVYLSTGMLDKLSDELIKGGYDKDTPAALVYRATWPEQKRFICTVGTLCETARKNDITKTAIVLVGDAIKQSGYERSKLYDPDFTTEYRKGNDSK
ncbi:MAG: precorrin-4 C(11)-methyltransferase [Lachnospiraceae bacterium]|nr:precorrin-4 C(11)-methyltransferase [Lachnospiraceae bacterium]